MKKRYFLFILIFTAIGLISPKLKAQNTAEEWSLKKCIDYAKENNITVKKSRLGELQQERTLDKTLESRYPSLNSTISEAFTNQKVYNNVTGEFEPENGFTGNYSLRSDMTIFNGFKITNTIQKQKLNLEYSALAVKETENNIEIAVTLAYFQVLFAKESVTIAENTLATSKAQLDRAKNLYDAGMIAESDYAQIRYQYSNDNYSLVQAQNNLSQQILKLKQLLELSIDSEISFAFPEIDSTQVNVAIPDKKSIYSESLKKMPEVALSELTLQMAELDYKIARADYLPNLNFSAGVSSGYNSNLSETFATQLGNNFYQNIGLNLNIPVYNRRQVRTNTEISLINIDMARLSKAETLKTLLESVETAYLDAITAKGRFEAAQEQLRYAEISYKLARQQFDLGMKNTVDLLTAKVQYLSAQQEYLQSKYNAIVNLKLLDFYQGKPIEL